jgi:hypothetical protein
VVAVVEPRTIILASHWQNLADTAEAKRGPTEAAMPLITDHTVPVVDQVRQIQVVAEALVVAVA